MTGSPEYADRQRGLGTFPEHWGFPEGRGSSEERVAWVTRNIAMDQELERRGFNAAEARSGRRSGGNPHAALAKIQRVRLQGLT